jgi:hypothetical protein
MITAAAVALVQTGGQPAVSLALDAESANI